MIVDVKIIEDSYAPNGVRLTTMQLVYPRYIHCEMLTHRVFSRNSSSSRAIPVKRLIQYAEENPVIPKYWGKNQKGMQATEEISEEDKLDALTYWNFALEMALRAARNLAEKSVHKQLVNRILEPFVHIRTIVTSTEWTNFYGLRNHPNAAPEIQELAAAMWRAQMESKPRTVPFGDWHLPYISDQDRNELTKSGHSMLAISAARCARVSYVTHDGRKPSVEEDLALYKRLVTEEPPHVSPLEHQATPANTADDKSGNFRGWQQFRHLQGY